VLKVNQGHSRKLITAPYKYKNGNQKGCSITQLYSSNDSIK